MDRDQEFTAFVRARSGRLVHFGQMLCGDPGLAEDMAQTALEKAYLRWDRIELGDPFAYVRQVIVNQHLSRLRRRPWRERLAGGTTELDLSSPAYVDDPAAGVHRRAMIDAALARLTARERAMVVLRYVEDLTEVETARVLGVAVGTVKSTMARALDKLRRSPELTDMTVGGLT